MRRGAGTLACCAGTLAGALLLASSTPQPPATGVLELPAGTLLLHQPLAIPDAAHDLEIHGNPAGSTLKAAPDFQGRALITARNSVHITLANLAIDGSRATFKARSGLPPSDTPFAAYYNNNGILLEGSRSVTIRGVSFTEVANYPVLVSHCSDVRIESVTVEDSGSLTDTGRNNGSGGILLEEGTTGFEICHSILRRVRGNAIWTHSNYRSPRNANGLITGNLIDEVARDAIQVGHATNVRVEDNTGTRIGYPLELVDMAGYAVPAALDTAGNVDKSVYTDNRFEDVNGKCIDLDGFHDGEVRDNSCISRKPYDQYPYAQYGIVMNNSNPDADPLNMVISGNLIEGAGYGGLFLLGTGNLVSGNQFLGLNRNRCTGDMTQARCNYAPGEPALLHSGIYLGRGGARRAPAHDNRIVANRISGFGIARSCIVAAPGVSLGRNRISGNDCTGTR